MRAIPRVTILRLCAILLAIAAFQAHAQTVVSKKNPSSDFGEMIAARDVLLFVVDDGVHGKELWKYNPKTNTTSLVQDILPGLNHSTPKGFCLWQEVVYFSADDNGRNIELWRSDGTSDGTYRLAEINQHVSANSLPKYFGPFQDHLYFVANDGVHGFELWRTDGVTTTMLKDIHPPGVDIGTTFAIAPFPDFALFRAATRAGPGELWRTDGTEDGTYELRIDDFHLESVKGEMVRLQDFALFVAESSTAGVELWRSDGTVEGTRMVRDIAEGPDSSDLSNVIQFGDSVLFQAKNGAFGMEPWISDGTEAGTRLLVDIAEGAEGSYPAPFRVVEDQVFFVANDGIHGRELWVTDGTARGTHLTRDVYGGSQGSDPYEVTPFGKYAFFSARDDRYGEELWISDGTENGTRMVKDINPGPALSEPYHLTVFDDILYFEADDGRHGSELWRSDGTADGTYLVADISWPVNMSASSQPEMLTAGQEQTYFIAHDFDGDWYLHRYAALTDGRVVKASSPSVSGKTGFHDLLAVEHGVFALVDNAHGGAELWYWDDAAVSAVLVGPAAPPQNGRTMAVDPGGTLHFAGYDKEKGTGLHSVAPPFTDAPVAMDIAAGPDNAAPGQFTTVGADLYFTASDHETGSELWRLRNGKPARVVDIRPGSAGSYPQNLLPVGERLYFTANDGTHGPELWALDVRDDRCWMVADLNPAQHDDAVVPSNLVRFKDAVLFAASDGVSGIELWRTEGDSKSTVQVKDLFHGPASSNPELFTVVEDDRVFFRAESPGCGVELFVSDGSADGTRLVLDLVPGSGHSYVNWLVPFNHGLAFAARSSIDGQPLRDPILRWTNGVSVREITVPGIPYGIFPQCLVTTGDTLLFTCDDGDHGRELWKTYWDGDSYKSALVADLIPPTRTVIAGPNPR